MWHVAHADLYGGARNQPTRSDLGAGTAYTTIMKPTATTDDALIIANTAAAGGALWATPAATTVISSPIRRRAPAGLGGDWHCSCGHAAVGRSLQPASAFRLQMVSVQGNHLNA